LEHCFAAQRLFVCLVFLHNISKSDLDKITKLTYIIMFHDDSWKPIYFGVKVTIARTVPSWIFALL